MNARNTLFAFALIALFSIFSFSIASAALELTVTSVPISVLHDQANIQILFKLKNTGNETQTGLDWSASTTSIGEWKTLPTLTSIGAGAEQSLSGVISIPKYSTGTINSQVKVIGDEESDSLSLAAILITNTPKLKLTASVDEIKSGQNGKIVVENIGNIQLNDVELNATGDFKVTFSENDLALVPGATKEITVSAVDLTKMTFGNNQITVTAKDSSQGSAESVVLKHTQSFCKNNSVGGNLEITNIDFSSDGDAEDEWKTFNTVTVEVDVKNTGSNNIADVYVTLGLFDSSGKNRVGDLTFDNSDEEEVKVGKLNDGDKETVTFKFKVSPDLDKGDYKLAIKVYSDDEGESKECSDISSDFKDEDFYRLIDVSEEEDEGKFIAFDNIEIKPTTEATCGDSVTINAEMFNVGTDDQDQIKVTLKNTEIKINLEKEFKSGLNTGDKEDVSFTFIIPAGTKDKTYTLELGAAYDYRSGNYRQSLDEPAEVNVKVIGCAIIPTQPDKIALITAELGSEARAGAELIVKTTITSVLAEQKDFVVRATGFESWAELNSISERLINLKEGESKEVTLSFTVNKDATGEKSFSIEAITGDKVESRDVAVNLAAAKPTFSLGNNSLIWIIGAINVILIILIIVVAARISRK